MAYPAYREQHYIIQEQKRKDRENACKVIFSAEIDLHDLHFAIDPLFSDVGSNVRQSTRYASTETEREGNEAAHEMSTSMSTIALPVCMQCDTAMGSVNQQQKLWALPCKHWHCSDCWGDHINKEYANHLEQKDPKDLTKNSKENDRNAHTEVPFAFSPRCPKCLEPVCASLAADCSEKGAHRKGRSEMLSALLKGLLSQRETFLAHQRMVHDVDQRLLHLVDKCNDRAQQLALSYQNQNQESPNNHSNRSRSASSPSPYSPREDIGSQAPYIDDAATRMRPSFIMSDRDRDMDRDREPPHQNNFSGSPTSVTSSAGDRSPSASASASSFNRDHGHPLSGRKSNVIDTATALGLVQETTAALEKARDELARTQDEEAFKDGRKRVEIYSLLQVRLSCVYCGVLH